MTTEERILRAAEDRIRTSGYNGFSFRDIAQDTGLTNAGVHHHFPTKADLVARVTREYAARFISALEETPPGERVSRLRELFHTSVEIDGKMCLCGLLAAESSSLPDAVSSEARRFFSGLANSLSESFVESTDPEGDALAVLARLEGAALVARIRPGADVFVRATRDLEGSSAGV